MTATIRSVDVGRLKTLAEKANREHSQAQGAARQSVKHAVEAGKLLLKAKEEVGHGNFLKWIEDYFAGSERTARKYMGLATAADQKRIDPGEVSSLAEAERLLREQNAEQAPPKWEPEVPGEEYDFREPGAESELQEPESEAQSPNLDEGEDDFDDHGEDDEPEQTQEDESESAFSKKSASKEPAPSKKKAVDPLRDALIAIGTAMGAVEGEERAEWARRLRDEIDLYIVEEEEAA